MQPTHYHAYRTIEIIAEKIIIIQDWINKWAYVYHWSQLGSQSRNSIIKKNIEIILFLFILTSVIGHWSPSFFSWLHTNHWVLFISFSYLTKKKKKCHLMTMSFTVLKCNFTKGFYSFIFILFLEASLKQVRLATKNLKTFWLHQH